MPLRTTSDLHDDGFDRNGIRQEVRAARLHRVRRSVFAAELPASEDDRHRQLVEATLPVCAPGSVVSHRSAAVLWGLPLIAGRPDAVELSRTDVNSGKHRGGVHLYVAGLDASEITLVDGIPVTTLARTVVDLARHLPLGPAVVVGDAALRAGMREADLEASLSLAHKRRGVAAARRACALLDARAETPGESLSRVLIIDAGLPTPVLQFEVRNASGRLVARTDFGWPELRTVGEFDGRIKYLQLLRPGQTPTDAVMAEKRRENAIRATGHEVVRWDWSDLKQFGPVVRALWQTFDRPR